MGENEPKTSKARVRRVLIDPLIRAGMRKQRGMTAEKYLDFIARLERRLGYMSEVHLRGLAVLLTKGAKGKERNQWPDEVTIISCAYGLQRPPPRSCDYVASLMRSAMGRAARDLGYHVELFDVAKRYGPPPSKYVLAQLQARADENRGKVKIIRDRIARDAASADDRRWLAWRLDQEAECMAILEAFENEGEAA